MAPTDSLDLIDEYGPEKIVCVSDARTGMRGVLVIDNTARGMGKGGTRMAPGITASEVARLARVMTWKWAVMDLFLGGAKAGIAFDPNHRDKEAALRAFVRRLRNEVPEEYVFGLDMGLQESDAAVILDELGDRGGVVGTPHSLGGLPYDELGITGFGVAEATAEAAGKIELDLATSSVTIQGFGAVGTATARRLSELGATIVAVSTSKGILHRPDGIDIARLLELQFERGDECVVEYSGKIDQPCGAELSMETDILIPAAMQDVVDASSAAGIKARLIVEGANLPITPDADVVLRERNITVIPDIVANAGGIIAAAYAMDARHSPFRVDPGPVYTSVSRRIREQTAAILDEADRTGTTSRSAARLLAQSRVTAAMRARGIPSRD
jgi:glutamate dehydrogenase (NAD(P)+)